MATLTLLGTGACEGIPAPFCTCNLCTYARAHGGKDRRRRFAVLLNEETLVDFGPDIMPAFRELGHDETHVRRILMTHSHLDHFQPEEMVYLACNEHANPVRLYCNREIHQALQEQFVRFKSQNASLTIHLNEPGHEVFDEDWGILPVRSTHGENGEQTVVYCVTAPDGHKALILSDTGWLPESSWQQLAGVEADAAVIEMSFGIHEPYNHEKAYHLGATSALEMLEKLRSLHALKPHALCVTAHISHCSNTRHAELEQWFQNTGCQPGYDGFSQAF
ncbi:MAG: hypothetical protein IJJ26_08815 [Victivallales bacterium]|nr:hypothetical protein [Victivallales bacterium]